MLADGSIAAALSTFGNGGEVCRKRYIKDRCTVHKSREADGPSAANGSEKYLEVGKRDAQNPITASRFCLFGLCRGTVSNAGRHKGACKKSMESSLCQKEMIGLRRFYKLMARIWINNVTVILSDTSRIRIKKLILILRNYGIYKKHCHEMECLSWN